MATTSTSSRDQDSYDRSTKDVKAFFDSWTIYQKAMNANYFGHREAYRALGSLLIRKFARGFSLIDFGCGDASFMSTALKGTTIEKYIGIEISVVALELARKNLAEIRCDRVLIEGDLLSVAEELDITADIIWIGLSLHHLPLEEKDRFFRASRRLLNPGGYLIFLEPTCLEGEDRYEHARRWWDICQRKWTVLSLPEMELLRDHIFSADYPETLEAIQKLATRNGFREVRSMFQDPDQLYEMVRVAV